MAHKVDVDFEVDFEKLIKKGKLLGLDGPELLTYVDKQEQEQRDRFERQREREQKRLLEEREKEREEKRLLEERRIDAELEKEKLRADSYKVYGQEESEVASTRHPPQVFHTVTLGAPQLLQAVCPAIRGTDRSTLQPDQGYRTVHQTGRLDTALRDVQAVLSLIHI